MYYVPVYVATVAPVVATAAADVVSILSTIAPVPRYVIGLPEPPPIAHELPEATVTPAFVNRNLFVPVPLA